MWSIGIFPFVKLPLVSDILLMQDPRFSEFPMWLRQMFKEVAGQSISESSVVNYTSHMNQIIDCAPSKGLQPLSFQAIIYTLLCALYSSFSLQKANSLIAAFNYYRALNMMAPVAKEDWLIAHMRKLFKKALGHRVCPSLDLIMSTLEYASPPDRRILWLFSLASVLSLRAMELAYLNPTYIHWSHENGCYEIRFVRNLTKRDSWLRRCPTYANEWIVAFLTYYRHYGRHPLECSIADYRTQLKRILKETVAASARHVGASYAFSVGVSHHTIAEFLGHVGSALVEVYIHKDWKSTATFEVLLRKFEELYGKSFLPKAIA